MAVSSGRIASSADESDDSEERDSKAASESAVAATSCGPVGDADGTIGRQAGARRKRLG